MLVLRNKKTEGIPKAKTPILKKNGEIIGKIEPEKRYYPVSKTITTEAGIFHKLFQDIYIVIGNTNNNGLSTIKIYQKSVFQIRVLK